MRKSRMHGSVRIVNSDIYFYSTSDEMCNEQGAKELANNRFFRETLTTQEEDE